MWLLTCFDALWGHTELLLAGFWRDWEEEKSSWWISRTEMGEQTGVNAGLSPEHVVFFSAGNSEKVLRDKLVCQIVHWPGEVGEMWAQSSTSFCLILNKECVTCVIFIISYSVGDLFFINTRFAKSAIHYFHLVNSKNPENSHSKHGATWCTHEKAATWAIFCSIINPSEVLGT